MDHITHSLHTVELLHKRAFCILCGELLPVYQLTSEVDSTQYKGIKLQRSIIHICYSECMCVSGMQRAYCGHIISVQFTLSSSAVAPFVYLLAGNFKYMPT